MNFVCFLLWFIFLDFPKELAKPGTIIYASFFSLFGGGVSYFFLKGSAWISVLIVFLILANDVSNLFFGIKFETCLLCAFFFVTLWFFKAFHIMACFYASVVIFMGLAQVLIREEKKSHAAIIFFISFLFGFCPADLIIVLWLIFVHFPASLKQAQDYVSNTYIIACSLFTLFLNWALNFSGTIPAYMTVTYIFFRGFIYLI